MAYFCDMKLLLAKSKTVLSIWLHLIPSMLLDHELELQTNPACREKKQQKLICDWHKLTANAVIIRNVYSLPCKNIPSSDSWIYFYNNSFFPNKLCSCGLWITLSFTLNAWNSASYSPCIKKLLNKMIYVHLKSWASLASDVIIK